MPEDGRIEDRPKWRDVFRRGGGAAPVTARRRRTLIRVGAVVVAIVVLLVVPGYIASQPTFTKRYASMNGAYDTWSTSVHAKVPCQRCHVRPAALAQAGYSATMLGRFYVSLVSRSADASFLPTPTNEACRSCHPDWRTVSPTGDLNIPHRAHVVVLKMQCVTCHSYLVHQKNPEGTHRPRMETCLTCHDGRTAKNSCVTCHTGKTAPANHRSKDWVLVHSKRQNEIDCTKCHAWTKNWCAECHSRRPPSHTADWRSTHGAAVKTHRNCEVCHSAAFCIRCHGTLPTLNFDPTVKPVQ